MDWTGLVFDLLDMRSFSNLWYWIALAVTWSSASHWVLGVPWDMALRARRVGGEAEEDFEAIVRVNVNRLLTMADLAGAPILAFATFALTSLAILGFWYRVEFSQAVFLIAFPLAIVGALSLRTARRIRQSGDRGEALRTRLGRHRMAVQALGMVSIFVTAFWGMLQNFNVSILVP
ncbi:MAG: component of SufBCD complex [Pseudomonadota bacterium]